MVQLHEAAAEGRLLVQIGSYNTNLQGGLGLPQDLVDWLAPTLQVSTFLSREPRAPDLVVVGFQELLPLHLGRPCSEPFCHTFRINNWRMLLIKQSRVFQSLSSTRESHISSPKSRLMHPIMSRTL